MTPYNDISLPLETFLLAYEKGAKRIQLSIKNLSEDELKQRPIPQKWSIWEILFHLTDAEILGAVRIRQTFAQSDRQLSYYNPAIWANAFDYQSEDMKTLKNRLRIFADLRESGLDIFKNATTEDWAKTTIHPQRGDISLLTILKLYADHSERHLEQILERRQLLGKPIVISPIFKERLY
jgi:uncharacterized damage-inducible protein DinB